VTPWAHRFVLEEAAFETFVHLADEERALAHACFCWLANQPHAIGQRFHNGATGPAELGELVRAFPNCALDEPCRP
jgi:hypothetical protein